MDALLSKEFLAAFAVTTPVGAIELNIGMRHIIRFLSRVSSELRVHSITGYPQGIPLHFTDMVSPKCGNVTIEEI